MKDVDWIHLTHAKDRRWYRVKKVMKPAVPQKAVNLIISADCLLLHKVSAREFRSTKQHFATCHLHGKGFLAPVKLTTGGPPLVGLLTLSIRSSYK
jgi:hypothetical protein